MKLPIQKLGTPIKTTDGVKYPWGVAVNQRGQIIVAEDSGYCISIFSPTGKKLGSFGSQGPGHGEFQHVHNVTVDDDSNILVIDCSNHCIQKFTPDGNFITTVGKRGNNTLV